MTRPGLMQVTMVRLNSYLMVDFAIVLEIKTSTEHLAKRLALKSL